MNNEEAAATLTRLANEMSECPDCGELRVRFLLLWDYCPTCLCEQQSDHVCTECKDVGCTPIPLEVSAGPVLETLLEMGWGSCITGYIEKVVQLHGAHNPSGPTFSADTLEVALIAALEWASKESHEQA